LQLKEARVRRQEQEEKLMLLELRRALGEMKNMDVSIVEQEHAVSKVELSMHVSSF